jgi:hypothetical protein
MPAQRRGKKHLGLALPPRREGVECAVGALERGARARYSFSACGDERLSLDNLARGADTPLGGAYREGGTPAPASKRHCSMRKTMDGVSNPVAHARMHGARCIAPQRP